MRVYIGVDAAAEEAAAVALRTLLARSTLRVDPVLLDPARLQAQGLLRRPVDGRGGLYDLHSRASMSTEFAISRFLVPMLSHRGWALFVDGDVVFLGDVGDLYERIDHTKAVMVVKHDHAPEATRKMVGREQTRYGRKNWSSVCLWNCDHPANRRLSLDDVNHRPGRDLHAFYWLHDSEIGELPAGWNWLVGEQPKPKPLHLAHFTNGGPWMAGWTGAEHDEIWLEARR